MNRIFKIKKNRFGVSVVTSELAKNKGKISSILFSALLGISSSALATPVSIQGSATSENAVSIGSNSYATAVDGIATGQGSIATGAGFNRDDFAQKVAENQSAIDAVNAKQDEINNKGNQLDATNDAIDSIGKQIDDLTKQQEDIADKISERDDLLKRRSDLQNRVDDGQSTVDKAKTDLDNVSTSGKNLYLNFTDVLNSLNWNILTSSSNVEQNRNAVAQELQSKIEQNYSDFADKYTVQDYRNIVDGYLNRQASYQGSFEYLSSETTDEHRNLADNLFFNKLYFKTKLDSTDYNITNDYKFYDFDSPLNQGDTFNSSASFGYYITKDNKVTRSTNQFNSNNSYEYGTFFKKLSELNNESVLNSIHLVSLSRQKALSKGEYSPLMGNISYYEVINRDMNLEVNGKNFREYYTKLTESSLDLGRIRFGLKLIDKSTVINSKIVSGAGNSNNTISPHFYDLNLGVLTKIKDLSVNNQNLISSSDIEHFKKFYKDLQNYYNAIDWDFSQSAINLTEYRTSLDKVITFNTKINTILDFYQSIINERKKSDSDIAKIDAWTEQMMALKSEVLDGISDKTNFGMGIELVYNKEWADYYIYYAKDEADAMIKRINSELKLYDDTDELIVEATSRAKEIQKAYDDAVDQLDKDQSELEEINKKIEELELTESEKSVDDTKRDKEQELAEREADKARLEDDIEKGKEELEKLREELAKTELKDLGLRSQAHGSNAFASGNDSIAIGTRATVTANDGIAIGRETLVTGKQSIAIGAESVVTGDKSIAIGVGHRVSGNRSTTIGDLNVVSGDDSFVAGNNNNVASNNVMVIGNSVTVTAGFDGAVVLGNKSTVSVANPTSSITIQDAEYKFAGTNPTSVVSVGSLDGERQIINVAAGRISETSTDAINGSQLYSAIEAINSIKSSINIIAGDNIKIDEKDHNFTISAADTNTQATVSAESGITVTESDNANGTKNYAVAAKLGKGLKIDDNGAIAATAQPIKGGAGVTVTVDAEEVQTVNVVGVTTTTDDGKSHTRSDLTKSVGVKGDRKNIHTTTTANGDVQVNMSDDIHVNSVSIHNGPNITQDGINANNTRITNVQDGVAPTDAVNVRQLNQQGNVLNQRIDNLANSVKKNKKRTDAGIAATAAMSNIPQVMLPGKSGIGVGVGNRSGQTAVAVGYSRASDNAKHIIKLSAGVDTQSKTTFGAGYMYQW